MKNIKSRKKTILYALTIIFSTICSVIPLIDIFIKQRVIDSITLKRNIGKEDFKFILILLFIFLIIKIINVFIKEQFLNKTRVNLIEDTLRGSINKTAIFRKRDNIEVIINNDITNIIDNYYVGYINLIATIVTSICSYVYAFKISTIIAVYSIIFMIATYIISKKGGNFVSKLVEINSKYLGNFLKFVDNIINNFRVIKTYKIEDNIKKEIHKNNQLYLSKNLEVKNKLALFNTFNAIIYVFQKLGIIVIGGILLYIGRITPGELVSIIFLSTLLSAPIITLNNNIIQIQSTQDIRIKIDSILKQSNNNIIKIKDESIILKDKIINYDNNIIINNFDLEIILGKKYLLLGHNGSGKSSLIDLILSEIIEKSDNNCSSTNAYLGLIRQNDSIIDTTISNNISLFKEIDTNKCTNILDSLEVNKSLKFNIDKNKRNVSGGEIQRILLGRAMYNNRSFLILDEAFSSLPKKLADKLTNNLLNSDKTIIMVSHHLQKEMLALFDVVIFINNKKLNKATTLKDKEFLYEEYIKNK